MPLLVSSLLLGLLCDSPVVASELPRGEIIAAVTVPGGDGSQSYAAYLPKAFRTDRTWPILYVFDPMARGELAVGLFVPAAERHGWVVVSSNNARNGPLAPIRAAVEAVWKDTRERLPIDSRRVYFAGMSGGTGAAWDMGKAFGAGVISCGGPPRTERETFTEIRFAFYAIAGDGDFNYGPMRNMARRVLKQGGEARFDVFSGGHGWAPPESLGRAVDWLELLAMRDGLAAREEGLVRTLYEETLARSRALEKTNAHHAALLYSSMERDFAGLLPVDDVRASAKRLMISDAARKAEKAETRLIRRGDEEYSRLSGLRRAITARMGIRETTSTTPSRGKTGSPDWDSLAFVDPRDVLLEELERHRKRMERKERTDDVLLSQQAFEAARVGFIEAARGAMQDGRWKDAAVDLDLAVTMRPDSAGLRIDLARALVATKEKKKALVALREAVARGYANADVLRNEQAFAPLRGDAEFEEIVAAAAARTPAAR